MCAEDVAAVECAPPPIRATGALQALLRNNANPNAENLEKETPLHLAVAKGTISVVKLLLDEGAKTRVQTKQDGHTPLHLAFRDCEKLQKELVNAPGEKIQQIQLRKESAEQIRQMLIDSDDELLDIEDRRGPPVRPTRSNKCDATAALASHLRPIRRPPPLVSPCRRRSRLSSPNARAGQTPFPPQLQQQFFQRQFSHMCKLIQHRQHAGADDFAPWISALMLEGYRALCCAETSLDDPYGADNERTGNALALQGGGAAVRLRPCSRQMRGLAASCWQLPTGDRARAAATPNGGAASADAAMGEFLDAESYWEEPLVQRAVDTVWGRTIRPVMFRRLFAYVVCLFIFSYACLQRSGDTAARMRAQTRLQGPLFDLFPKHPDMSQQRSAAATTCDSGETGDCTTFEEIEEITEVWAFLAGPFAESIQSNVVGTPVIRQWRVEPPPAGDASQTGDLVQRPAVCGCRPITIPQAKQFCVFSLMPPAPPFPQCSSGRSAPLPSASTAAPAVESTSTAAACRNAQRGRSAGASSRGTCP